MFNLTGQICLVTGASGLIGQEICRALAFQGAIVLAVYRTCDDALKTLSAALTPDCGKIESIQCDLRQRDALAPLISSLLQRHGRLDALVCCAGKSLRKAAMLSNPDDYDDLFDLNVNVPMQLCRHVLRPMFRQNAGRIILVGSHAGSHGLPGQSAYAASKAALQAYAKSLAAEVGARNITVNVVAPGVLEAPANTMYSAQEQEHVCNAIGLKRAGRPAEVASVVAFLASPAAAYISGAVIPVDGAARF